MTVCDKETLIMYLAVFVSVSIPKVTILLTFIPLELKQVKLHKIIKKIVITVTIPTVKILFQICLFKYSNDPPLHSNSSMIDKQSLKIVTAGPGH
jgi:hypothetical protein